VGGRLAGKQEGDLSDARGEDEVDDCEAGSGGRSGYFGCNRRVGQLQRWRKMEDKQALSTL
jgi:hypothetical protein